MKKILMSTLILLSVAGPLFAQLPGKHPRHQFDISLGNGNKVIIELENLDDLDSIVQIDSILTRLLRDIDQLKDTIGNPQHTIAVKYLMDIKTGNKLSFRIYTPVQSDFIFANNEVSALKLVQDTVKIIGYGLHNVAASKKSLLMNTSYSISFFLNYLNDLRSYPNGILQTAFNQLKKDAENQRKKMRPKEEIKADYTILGQRVTGGLSSKVTTTDYLSPVIGVSVQNYKSWFAPSFSLGATVTLNKRGLYRHEIGLAWEPLYFFEKDDKGKMQTRRNEFLTLNYGYGLLKGQNPRKNISMQFVASFSYLIRRKGDYFEPQSFRLGAGKLLIFEGKTSIEPMLYFNDFFRNVTPGLRLTQSF